MKGQIDPVVREHCGAHDIEDCDMCNPNGTQNEKR